MAVTNYYSFGGEILGEETGGVRRDYLTDALGSVTATVTEAGTVENTYRYKPYGEQLAKTGTGSDPKFLWNGKWGYRKSLVTLCYVRSRLIQTDISQWTTVDLLWPKEPAYTYVRNNPTKLVDFSGKHPCENKPCEYARTKLPPDQVAVRGGTIVCCAGKVIACVWPPLRPPGWHPGIIECLQKHEDDHAVWDWRGATRVCDYCKGKDFDWPTLDWRDRSANECRATSVEVDCLKRKRAECYSKEEPLRSRCLEVYRKRICQDCKYGMNWCKKTGLDFENKKICTSLKCQQYPWWPAPLPPGMS